MVTASDVLRVHRIAHDGQRDRFMTTCPECSHLRKKETRLLFLGKNYQQCGVFTVAGMEASVMPILGTAAERYFEKSRNSWEKRPLRDLGGRGRAWFLMAMATSSYIHSHSTERW